MLTIGAHWSPLELEIVDDDDNNLIKVLLTIGGHWSCRLKMSSIFQGAACHWNPLKSIGVGDCR